MEDIPLVLTSSPAEIHDCEIEAETAKYEVEMSYAIAFLREKVNASSIAEAEELAKLDSDYQESRAKEIHSIAKYKKAQNEQINARKLAEMVRAGL